MKITNDLPPIGPQPQNSAARAEKPATPAAAPATHADGERVEFSAFAEYLQKMDAGEAPVDETRVSAIRQAISEGHFQIHPERIADRLLEGLRELFARSR